MELSRLARNAGAAATAHRMLLAFRIASDQHSNFYEDDFAEDVVLAGLIDCEEFSQQLYALFWPAGAPAPA